MSVSLFPTAHGPRPPTTDPQHVPASQQLPNVLPSPQAVGRPQGGHTPQRSPRFSLNTSDSESGQSQLQASSGFLRKRQQPVGREAELLAQAAEDRGEDRQQA